MLLFGPRSAESYTPEELEHINSGGRIEYTNDMERWFDANNELHRECGPAVMDHDTCVWFVHGVNHRIGGPAFESLWEKQWVFENQYHRTDGPAIESTLRGSEWFLFGQKMTQQEYAKAINEL